MSNPLVQPGNATDGHPRILSNHKREEVMASAFNANLSMLSNSLDCLKLVEGMTPNGPMTFHCEQCNIVLGDHNGVCGELECMDSIICLRVTQNVVVSDEVELALKGKMAYCIYSALKCSGCHSVVGALIDSTPEHLDMVRGIFLLHKENINWYGVVLLEMLLKDKRLTVLAVHYIFLCAIPDYNLIDNLMVKASKLSFDLKPLLESMKKVMQQIQTQADRMSLIEKRLSEKDNSREMD